MSIGSVYEFMVILCMFVGNVYLWEGCKLTGKVC